MSDRKHVEGRRRFEKESDKSDDAIRKGVRVEFKAYFDGVEAGTRGVIRRADEYRISVEVGDRRVNVPPNLKSNVLHAIDEKESALNPVVMSLRCPGCMAWHDDAPGCEPGPHQTHRCRVCDHEWTPREFPTHGAHTASYSDELLTRVIRATLEKVAPGEGLEVQGHDVEMFRTFLELLEQESHLRMRARVQGLRDASRILDAVVQNEKSQSMVTLAEAATLFNGAIARNRNGKPAILRPGEVDNVRQTSVDGEEGSADDHGAI
ncbi:hypothetical protein [Paraburkholderia humisilvae]|uniref:Uncharacterized protein n=1 Tax=Paraburkholderia humisilvae TaxID=627669 RepID=A0A6J5DM26_9BURK|nr:hypothetical protein [Paraburkholderia humisilvae]CAB3754574.1 hypothetical protein LMG29542_02387 [Paraburkholderia humisilvae]